MEIKNEEKFSSFTESIKQLDKQGFELMSDIKLLFDEISKVESSVDDTELKIQIESLKESIADIQLQKGDKGDKGEDGKNGLNGKDGKDGRDGIDGIDGLNGKDGEKGEDGSPDTAEDIVKKINTLESVIERKTIKGLDNLVDQPGLDRALGILDQRTQYLINKTVVQPNLAGYVPTTRTLTINGVTEDLSADRTWSVGTVTDVAALTLGTTGTDLSSSVATGTTTPVITLNVPTASALNRGALSSTDWSTFNSKESALTFSTGLTRTTNTITANLSTGVSGGQSVIGGTASGNNLTLSSTSNATKGKIIFGTSAYDEVNNRLGVGTTSPVASLDVISPSGGAGTGIRLIQATNNVIQPYSYTSIDFTVPTTGLIGQFFATASNYSNPNVNLAANSIGLLAYHTNAQLLLGAVGSNGYISFDTGGYGYSNERMRILANGNVGIGTNAPSAKLEVRGISDFWGLQVGNGTVGALFQVYGGKAGFVGFNGSAYNSLDIRSGISTQLFLATNGNVGIGTTTPGNLLSIVGNSSTPGGVAFNVKNSNVSGDTRFSLSSSNNRTLNVQVTGDSYVVNQKGAYLFTDGGLSNMTFMTDGDVGSGGSGYISFATGGYTLTTQERMRITSTGNIGIGITSPSAVLHLKAGTASAGTAPIKLTSGTRLTVVESGTVEFTTNNFYLSPSSTVRLTAGLGTNGTLYSTAFGLDVLNGNTTGAENTGFGYYALRANTTGVGNTSLGVGCLVSNTQGSRNVAVGYGALNVFNSTSNVITSNTAIGNAAMFSTTTGVFNTAVGGYVAQQAQSSYGTYYGIQAGYTVHGNYNLAIGHFAMGSTTINAGTYNIAIGTNALLTQTAGANNIGIGTSTMVNLTGAGNVAIGFSALNAVIGGGYNISLGFQSGNAITTGSKNVTIGYDVDAQSNTADGQLSIQNAIFGTGNTGTGTTASTGNIGIYIPAPSARLHLPAGTATANTAPLKLTSGTNLTTPEDGALEYDGTELYFTPSTTRYKLGQVTAGSSTIASGTYTPTLTGVTNVTSTTAYVCQYMRVGNVVTVSGKIEVTPTVNNAQTTIGVSLPIASNFANSQECGGAAHSVANTVLGHGAAIYADATNDRAEMDYFETHGASDTFSFSFTYQII